MMAGSLAFRTRAFARATPLAAAMLVTVLLVGNAMAQAAAPIVYKSAAKAPMQRVETRADVLSLDVAPHAPIPRFSNTAPAAALDLRPGAPKATFGPAPLAARRILPKPWPRCMTLPWRPNCRRPRKS